MREALYSKTRKILTHRLRKYLSTFKKGFLDDTSYVDITLKIGLLRVNCLSVKPELASSFLLTARKIQCVRRNNNAQQQLLMKEKIFRQF